MLKRVAVIQAPAQPAKRKKIELPLFDSGTSFTSWAHQATVAAQKRAEEELPRRMNNLLVNVFELCAQKKIQQQSMPAPKKSPKSKRNSKANSKESVPAAAMASSNAMAGSAMAFSSSAINSNSFGSNSSLNATVNNSLPSSSAGPSSGSLVNTPINSFLNPSVSNPQQSTDTSSSSGDNMNLPTISGLDDGVKRLILEYMGSSLAFKSGPKSIAVSHNGASLKMQAEKAKNDAKENIMEHLLKICQKLASEGWLGVTPCVQSSFIRLRTGFEERVTQWAKKNTTSIWEEVVKLFDLCDAFKKIGMRIVIVRPVPGQKPSADPPEDPIMRDSIAIYWD